MFRVFTGSKSCMHNDRQHTRQILSDWTGCDITQARREYCGESEQDCRVESERVMMTVPRRIIPGKTAKFEAEKHGSR